MGNSLLQLQPHKVSRDLSGYITYVFGPPKTGKTTLGSEMPKPLLLAFEKGYNALAGIIPKDITTWSELKQTERELKDPEVKALFSTIIVDTVDVAAVLCDKYVCSQNGVDSISQIPYGGGWGLLKKEFEGVFRRITQMGYAVYFISHAKESSFKRSDGSEYTQIHPSVSTMYNGIIENMADLYGYMHPVIKDGENKIVITWRSADGTISCGGRFKYMTPETPSNYNAIVKALNSAIDKEAEVKGKEFVTDEREAAVKTVEFDFDAMMNEFSEIIGFITQNTSEEDFGNNWAPRVTQIVETYLGKGKKVSNCTRDQVEMLSLIVTEMRELKEKFTQEKI